MLYIQTLSIPSSSPRQVYDFSVSAASSTPPLLQTTLLQVNKNNTYLYHYHIQKYINIIFKIFLRYIYFK